MKITQAGIDLIKSFEECRLLAYPDGGGVMTVGWGHTGPEVVQGLSITQDRADALFLSDLTSRDAEIQIECPDATPEQHSAMLALMYNIGIGNFHKSSVRAYHNAGDHVQAAASFGLWNKVAGQVSAGLVRRRAAEAELYKSTGVAS